jgi:hypothetical protein
MAVEKLHKCGNSMWNKEEMSLQFKESICLFIRRVMNQIVIGIEA